MLSFHLYFLLNMLHKVLYYWVLTFAFQGYWVYVFMYVYHVVTCKQTSIWSAAIMWYPCVLTTGHILIMVTRKSFYVLIILFLISPVRFYKILFTHKLHVFFSLVLEDSLLIPVLSSSPLYLWLCYICKSLDNREFH